MSVDNAIYNRLKEKGMFEVPGAYVLVDGQYGSTGKGLAAAVLADCFASTVDAVVSNAGPNSGHTCYYGNEKIVLKQLPSFAVYAKRMGKNHINVYMNGGAVIDPTILMDECVRYGVSPFVHASAAVADEAAKYYDQQNIEAIGSTGKGTGAALASKVMRIPTSVVMGNKEAAEGFTRGLYRVYDNHSDIGIKHHRVFVEVSQGFSLGINAGFYPYCTSRDCTVSQAINDAGFHPLDYRQSMMVVRTFPIRVAGNSGPMYPDQEETTWEQLGQTPEHTTVTNKVRRVFTWSDLQYRAALRANRPDHIFLNFCNYLRPEKVDQFVVQNVLRPYLEETGYNPKSVLLGYGPRVEDVRLWER